MPRPPSASMSAPDTLHLRDLTYYALQEKSEPSTSDGTVSESFMYSSAL